MAVTDAQSNSVTASASGGTQAPPAPTAPTAISPSGNIGTENFIVGWGGATGSIAYYILTQRDGSANTLTNFTINAPATTSAQMGSNGNTYHYWVVACNVANMCSAESPHTLINICVGGCP